MTTAVGSLIQHISGLRGQVNKCEVGKNAVYKEIMANQTLENILPTYSGLVQGINQIACKLFQGNSFAVEQVPFDGLSGSVFYQVKDTKADEVLCLAKVFPEDRSYEFLDEVFSLHAYGQHSIPCPKVLDVGLIEENQKKRCVLIEEMIPGDTLKHHIDKLFDCEKGFENREQQMLQVTELFKSLGSSFASFHSKGSSEFAPTDPYVKEHFLGIINNAIEELQNANDEVDEYYGITDKNSFIESLQEYINKSQHLMQKPVPRSYIHADCNFANFIYGKDKQFHLLDTWWGGFSVDKESAPRGNPFLDYMQVINRLWYSYQDDKLTFDEFQKLQTAFQQGYKTNGTIPDEDMQNFYSFIDAMLLLGGVTKYFHVGAKDSIGHLAKYWMTWLEKLLDSQHEIKHVI
ncbi:MAG: hypothetical protein K1000chlam3_01782 [Chlamydiae bacterium]|nr:hypothetical protein [Chlamydiota bacterium]